MTFLRAIAYAAAEMALEATIARLERALYHVRQPVPVRPQARAPRHGGVGFYDPRRRHDGGTSGRFGG